MAKARVLHELRNALTSISAHTELLELEASTDRAKQSVEGIKRQLTRVYDLVEQMDE